MIGGKHTCDSQKNPLAEVSSNHETIFAIELPHVVCEVSNSMHSIQIIILMSRRMAWSLTQPTPILLIDSSQLFPFFKIGLRFLASLRKN